MHRDGNVASDWSREEVESVIADYIAMLTLELRHEPYNKAAHRRQLLGLLNERSESAIERKHQNISAILIELGYPYISGYKPLGNYQTLLYASVVERLHTAFSLTTAVQQAVEAPAQVPSVTDLLSRLEAPPVSQPSLATTAPTRSPPSRRNRPSINYLEREAHNASLGKAGELFVLNFERARLIHLGRENLADRVEHIAVTEGDGAGFDIRSFEADQRERFIEVKTTAYGKQLPFFVSRHEVSVSQAYSNQYHLYRVFQFRDDPRLYTLAGALDQVCQLTPVQFTARIA